VSGLPPPLEPPALSEGEAFAAFVGAWQLVLWTTFHADGSRDHPFGTNAVGQILYSADGHMSCHLMRGRRSRLDTPIYEVSDAALGRVLRDYTGYFGRFSLDATAGVVIHHVTGAWYPDWIGIDQPRRYAFQGDRLLLEAEVGPDLVRIEWQRIVAPYALGMVLAGGGEMSCALVGLAC